MRFEVILIDPPWSYSDKGIAGRRGSSQQYNVMTLDDIKALDLKSIAAENCSLFLWATAPLMPEAISVIESLDFKYKTIAFTWVKITKGGKLFWGMGHSTRSNPEFLLLATRGKPKRVSAGVHSVILAENAGHSVKPQDSLDKIVELMGDVPRVEIFARHKRRGWVTVGDGIDGKDIRVALRELADS